MPTFGTLTAMPAIFPVAVLSSPIHLAEPGADCAISRDHAPTRRCWRFSPSNKSENGGGYWSIRTHQLCGTPANFRRPEHAITSADSRSRFCNGGSATGQKSRHGFISADAIRATFLRFHSVLVNRLTLSRKCARSMMGHVSRKGCRAGVLKCQKRNAKQLRSNSRNG